MPADNCGHFLIIVVKSLVNISCAGKVVGADGKLLSEVFYVFSIFIGLRQFNRVDYVFWWRVVLRRAGVPKRPNGPHL